MMEGTKFFLVILICCASQILAYEEYDNDDDDRLFFPGRINIPEHHPEYKSSVSARQAPSGSISNIALAHQNDQRDQINKFLTSGTYPVPPNSGSGSRYPESPTPSNQGTSFTQLQSIKDRYDEEQHKRWQEAERQKYEQERYEEEYRNRLQQAEYQRQQELLQQQQQAQFQQQQQQQQYFPQQQKPATPTGTENYIDPLNFQLPMNSVPRPAQTRPHQPTESDAITAFSWRLFKGIKPPNRHTNIIVSPLLTQLSLALLEQGAEGESKYQIHEAVQSSPEFLANVVHALKNTQASTSLEYSAALFLSNFLKLNRTFAERAKQSGSDVVAVDFPNQSSAIKQINGWIARATRNHIPNFLDSNTPTQGIDMLIANAIFFKSIWRHPFNETFKGDFQYQDGHRGPVTYMRVAKHMRTGVVDQGLSGPSGGFKWVEIPYAGGEFSMILMVPKNKNTLEDLIRVLTPDHLSSVMDDLDTSMTHIVKLQMPKFHLKSRASLTKSLLEMGITNIFTSTSNLPYIAVNAPVVRVTDCIQHAVLNVDELGTVATAVNSFSVITLSISVPDPEISFVVDEPFLALIVDKRQKVPIFITKIYNP